MDTDTNDQHNIGMHLNHRHKTHIVCYLEARGGYSFILVEFEGCG
jgi:hypothetical protein